MAENVLFVRSEEDNDDPWDDTMLIKAYDAALAKVEKQIKKDQNSTNKSTKPGTSKTEVIQWRKQQSCSALYSEDGQYYEGNILKIVGDTALVRFLGYGNVETVKLTDLRPSQGNAAKTAQRKDAKLARASQESEESMEVDTDSSAVSDTHVFKKPFPPHRLPPMSSHSIEEEDHPFPPPPPPPVGMFSHGPPPGDDEILHSMLMSWYMSGYHTGYYEGRKAAKKV